MVRHDVGALRVAARNYGARLPDSEGLENANVGVAGRVTRKRLLPLQTDVESCIDTPTRATLVARFIASVSAGVAVVRGCTQSCDVVVGGGGAIGERASRLANAMGACLGLVCL